MTTRGKLKANTGRQTSVARTRAAIIVPQLARQYLQPNAQGESSRSLEALLEEARGLAAAIDLDVVHSETLKISAPRPATLIGSGTVAAIASVVAEMEIGLVIVDHPLTPVQQRNLERSLNTKVIDRTGLILEIFGRRAKTKEGVLQVELAHLTYQKGRLVRSWTHLERQRSGGGFLGGPGETQIELDRRMLQDRIDRLKLDLEQVTRTRKLHRAKRKKVPNPVVALVGYTNAGTSTLFNQLTGAGVLAEDMLFATLDPTLRRLQLPHGRICILSDTVGFISNLPTHLVAAFRATLEEVIEADLILHVRDIADPDTAAQANDVNRILADLGISAEQDKMVIDIWNKVDLIDPAEQAARFAALNDRTGGTRRTVAVSAITGEGVATLLGMIEESLAGALGETHVTLPRSMMGDLDWIYRNAEIISRMDNDDGTVSFNLRMSALSRKQLEEKLAQH